MRKLHLLALAGTIACASANSGTPDPVGAPGTAQDRNVITQEEIQTISSTNLYELIEKVRPNMLRSRGATSFSSAGQEFPLVYVDGRPYGDLASLKSLIANQVSRVRYYDAPAAAAKFGMINAPGVIDVTIRQ
ncbi:MAG TPA: Plug domain-containing protein [Gemmatimonadaceae bacterium]|jgi:hypothetical protein